MSKHDRTGVIFITLTLHNVYAQHGGGSTKHRYYLANDAAGYKQKYQHFVLTCFYHLLTIVMPSRSGFVVDWH